MASRWLLRAGYTSTQSKVETTSAAIFTDPSRHTIIGERYGPEMERNGEGHLPVVTIAALYGASGTIIGPRVAERLGVPFLDREIPEGVAERAGLPEQAVASIDEAIISH